MRVLESVSQNFIPDKKLLALMDTFRRMVNDCIRIGLEQNRTSMKSLSLATYPYLKQYDIKSYYRLCANSRAAGILSNYRKLLKKRGRRKKGKIPCCTKPTLTTCYQISIENGNLNLTGNIVIPLNDYVLKRIQRAVVRSVTVSAYAVNLCIAKQVDSIECTGVLGIDMNYANMTFADTQGNIKRLPMEEVAETKLKYREVKKHFSRNDVRISKEICGKYGKLQADKTQSEIHKFTSRIIKYAKRNRLAVVMEELKDIRKLSQKGNGQGADFRFKLNAWARGEARRQLEYKGKSEGVLVFSVSARGTSAKCSRCGSKTSPEENRMLYCAPCDLLIDRDQNAAINIRNRGLEKLFSMRFKPIGLSSEAVKRNPVKELATEVILRADDSHSSQFKKVQEDLKEPV